MQLWMIIPAMILVQCGGTPALLWWIDAHYAKQRAEIIARDAAGVRAAEDRLNP